MYLFHENPDVLQSFLRQSVLSAELLKDNGLYEGKMNKVLFFIYYAQHTHNPLYTEFAFEIIDKILETINIEIGIGFEYGLSGIGWGFLHLMKMEILEPDGSVLEEIDNEIMKYDPRRFDDFTFDTGLAGVLYYINYRLSLSFLFKEKLPFDTLYHSDLQSFICSKENFSEELIEQTKLYKALMSEKRYINMEGSFILEKYILSAHTA